MEKDLKIRDLVIEHSIYFARIEPVVRARLKSGGKSEQEIARYVSKFPNEHLYVILRRLYLKH